MAQGLKYAGMPSIRLAGSVRAVACLDDFYARYIMDRSNPITERVVNSILAQSIFTWEGRNPAPALDPQGNFQGTDLDLLSLLVPLRDRGAIIEIPRYCNRRQIVVKVNERKIGTNQFGAIRRLVSHKDVFSFSVGITDQTIAVTDALTGDESLGAPRSYMIIDCDGHWYDGWDRIVFKPNVAENTFLTEKRLWTNNTVYFKYYVHLNRWQSVFGAPYLLLKMLLARLDDEAGFYRKEVNRLQADGITFPGGNGGKAPYEPPEYEGETKAIEVDTLEMAVDLPALGGKYPAVPATPQGLAQAYGQQKLLTYTIKPRVQFVVRADEAAYFLYGRSEAGTFRVAPWMGDARWNPWKKPRSPVTWNRMVLAGDTALRFRTRTVLQHISAE